MAKSKTYEEFVEKFKPKKTTDDCYTPDYIYDVIKDWAVKEYGIDESKIVRPFWPGGDYKAFEYAEDCVVLDNPPFSIITPIVKYYQEHGIKYFLFAPGLTLPGLRYGAHYVCVGASIEYENGAVVNTNFVSNLEPALLRSAPDLNQTLEEATKGHRTKTKFHPPKYSYPDNVVTAAKMNYLAQHDTLLKIMPEDGVFIRSLESQREKHKSIFGGGCLISEKAAAEKAAAEKAAATRWPLSDSELEIIESAVKPLASAMGI